MPGTLGRLRFYCWCDLSALTVDYAPPLQDYPEYPRNEKITLFRDIYKSALGSNYWVYHRGTSGFIGYDWVQVSDEAWATMSLICGSATPYKPHIAIFEGNGIDGITLGSLLSTGQTHCKGTFFFEADEWDPQEVNFGLWNFTTPFRRES